MAKVNVVVREGMAALSTNNVPCSGLTLALDLDDDATHDEADASCMFWVRRTTTSAHWLDFVHKRLEYVNYPEIQVTSLRIRYLGELPLATIQTFDVP